MDEGPEFFGSANQPEKNCKTKIKKTNYEKVSISIGLCFESCPCR